MGFATGGGGGEWKETGSNEVVPIDGETVGDGTTSVDHQSVTTSQRSVTNLGTEVFEDTSTSIPNSTFTKIGFDGIESDDNNNWDGSNDRFDVPRDGDYHVDGHIQVNKIGDSRLAVNILLNGSTGFRVADTTAAGGASEGQTKPISRTFKDLNSGDTLAIEVFQDSGSSENTKNGRENCAVTFTHLG